MKVRVKPIVHLGIALISASLLSWCMGQTATVENNQRQSAITLEQQGKNSEAQAAWRAVLKVHPRNSEAYAHLGLLEARKEHYSEAVPLYRRALALAPAMPGLRLNLGLSLFKSGALKEAIETFTPLLNSEPPSSSEALRLTTIIGLAHYGLGEYAAAIPYLKEASGRDPQNLPFRLALAHSCLWAKEYQCVFDVYHQILALNAESAEADMLTGEAMDEMKDVVGATQQFRAAVKANPREPNVHFGLGYLLWVQKQYAEATQEFQAELANNPNHNQALTYLADASLQMGNPEAAFPLFQKAIQMDPGIELAHLDLGILYANAGRQDDALRELKVASRLSPNDVNVHWHLARLYQVAGMKELAKAEFNETRNLTKAADETVFKKLSGALAKGADAERDADAPTERK
jgi:tetratricopeptide (TPR) repeat protein